MTALACNVPASELALRLDQQRLVAELGLFALGAPPLDDLLDEACRVASLGLGTSFTKVLRPRPEGGLLVVAGVGWRPGTVGHAVLGEGMDSPAGYALHTGQPVLCNNLRDEPRFRVPALLAEHGVQSALNVAIGAGQEAYGVLEADSTARHEFVAADTAFLQSLANIIAAAAVRAKHEAEAAQAKDALLRGKDLLMQEVHHRVKNSLQLVQTLLHLQARGTDPAVRRELHDAARRIGTVGAVHQRLYEGGSVEEADGASFLRALLRDFGSLAGRRELVLEAEPLLLPADQVTPLGLVVSELVTNALKYGQGRVTVFLRRVPAGLEVAVADEGPGFPEGFNPRAVPGLGMKLVLSLAKGDPASAVRVDRNVPHARIVVALTL